MEKRYMDQALFGNSARRATMELFHGVDGSHLKAIQDILLMQGGIYPLKLSDWQRLL